MRLLLVLLLAMITDVVSAKVRNKFILLSFCLKTVHFFIAMKYNRMGILNMV